ncbi:MAG TPA: DUF3500 domain-containing protein [Burkholderiales bacterium]|nr:DUF3500 domain-containing protein [Burkholderiales bacterium]
MMGGRSPGRSSALAAAPVLALLAFGPGGCQLAPPEPAPALPQAAPRVPPPPPGYLERAQAALAEPFVGITTEGRVVPGLFPLRATGVSTRPLREAAEAFLAALDERQRARTLFAADSEQWRNWSNIHRYPREGVAFAELSRAQREKALKLLEESLSLRGLRTVRDIMRLNQTAAELTGRYDEYGEDHYWLTVMGTPSDTAPWGWQLEGHHLVINFFVLKDQVVMTPTFMGSEPTHAASGKYAGTRVLHVEEQTALGFVNGLTPAQRAKAILSEELPPDVFASAFRDNLRLRYEGIRYAELTPVQQAQLLSLIELYVGNLRPGHAKVKMEEVRRHLADTWFAWMGGTGRDSVFYYRIHSPVILIEFDHQRGVALPGERPSRNHIHTVVRTPNGNDYGRDLLRQHHARYHHAPDGRHIARSAPARPAGR